MRASLVTALGISFTFSVASAQAPAAQPATPPSAAPPATAPPSADSPAPASEAPPADDSLAPAGEAGADVTTAADPSAGLAVAEQMSEAELLELGLGVDQPAVDTSLRLSGFIDFGMQIAMNEFSKVITNEPAFAIGNLNLYISKNISESIRTMAEIRFLYLPHGASSGALNDETVDTSTSDYTDFNRIVHWGGVEIERVYLEWSPHRYLTIRAGQFLTPYGVWNVDHGSPTIIPAAKPYVIGVGYFPERQTGLELYGRAEATNYSSIGYHLTLSNGTGPVSEWKEFDKNKAFGARAYWELRRLGEFRLGGSAYYGRDTDGVYVLAMADGAIRSTTTINSQSDWLAFGIDGVWRYRGIHIQAEWVSLQRKYTDKGRTPTVDVFTQQSQFPADSFAWGAYGLLGYRFEWFGIMPFVVYQKLDQPDTTITGWHFGLNARPIDALALKAQYDVVEFSGQASGVRIVYLQVAWAF